MERRCHARRLHPPTSASEAPVAAPSSPRVHHDPRRTPRRERRGCRPRGLCRRRCWHLAPGRRRRCLLPPRRRRRGPLRRGCSDADVLSCKQRVIHRMRLGLGPIPHSINQGHSTLESPKAPLQYAPTEANVAEGVRPISVLARAAKAPTRAAQGHTKLRIEVRRVVTSGMERNVAAHHPATARVVVRRASEGRRAWRVANNRWSAL